MKHTRRGFVRLLFAAGSAAAASRLLPAAALAAAPSEASTGGLNFIVFGDWGRRGHPDQLAVATQMARAARDIDARFVISVGDNFYENGVTSVEDDHWQKSFEEVYNAPSLQVPWHVILGNHDYHGDCDAQLAYGKEHPRWGLPARYYVQTQRLDAATTADFFYIDTTPMIKSYYQDANHRTAANVRAQDVPAQIAWLKGALAASKAQWKMVVGHHPIYSSAGVGETPELIELVLPLLHEYKVQAYFNGHDHDLEHLVAGEVNLFDSGAGSIISASTRTSAHSKFARYTPGFIAATLQPDNMRVNMIDGTGKSLYSVTVPRIPLG